MQQSSATQSLHLWFLGVAEDCCMLSILLVVSTLRMREDYGTWSVCVCVFCQNYIVYYNAYGKYFCVFIKKSKKKLPVTSTNPKNGS